jgi:hypothetical protein
METVNMKRILFVTVLLTLLLSACGAAATPTADPASIQASAVAAANTMVALTQAAIPTETPIPPTPLPSPTELPSPTLLALPTLDILASPTFVAAAPPIGATSGSDTCQSPLVAKPGGPQIPVRIINSTKGSIILSLYLQKTSFGECGYRSFNLSANDSASTTMPKGCYSAGAFVTEAKKSYRAFGAGCAAGDTKVTVNVRPDGTIRITQ